MTNSTIAQTISHLVANQKERLIEIKTLLSNTPIVVFGAGNLGKKICSFLISKGCNVAYLADNNSNNWEKEINGVKIISPASAANIHPGALFIVCIWSPNHSFAATKKQLIDAGITNIIHAATLMQLFPDELLPYYQFNVPDFFINHVQQIEKVYDLLSDDESKRQYAAHVACRINLDFESLPIPDIANQYFPSDIIKLNDREIFFDAGAYDGDTLKSFVQHLAGNTFKKYIALEPDPNNKKKLLSSIEALGLPDVEVYPYAVGNENEILKFDATGGGGAVISATGTIDVACVRIDDKFIDQPVTFLKLDIEGSEMPALNGAEQLIDKYRPIIAVCIYHLPDDLWTIPLYIKQRFPYYKLYARTHQYDGMDFVLYAIPE